MKINVFGVVCFIGILVILGAVGASDLEAITIAELAWRCLIGLGLFLIGGIGGYKFENR